MTQQLLKMLGTLLWILSATERYFKRNDCTNRSSTKLLFLYFEKIIEKKKKKNKSCMGESSFGQIPVQTCVTKKYGKLPNSFSPDQLLKISIDTNCIGTSSNILQ